MFVDASSAYLFTSALLLRVLNLPRYFTSILIVGVSVACAYAVILWSAVSNVDIAIPVRTLDGLYLLMFLTLLVFVMLMSLIDLNLGCSRLGAFCVTLTFIIVDELDL